MLDFVSIGISLAIAVMIAWVIVTAIRKRKSWFLVGLFFVNLNGAIWTIFLELVGLSQWMVLWRTGYSILFLVSLIGLIYEAQSDN